MFSSSVASGCTWTWTKALWARLQQCCGLMGYLQKALGEKLPCVWGRCPEAMITITLSVNVGKRWDDAFFRASLTFMWRLWTCFVLCFFSRLFLTQNCRYSVYLFLLTVFNSHLLKSEDSFVIALGKQNVSVVAWAAMSYFCTDFFSCLMLMSVSCVSRIRKSLKQLIFNTL